MGGHLVTITSAKEQEIVEELMRTSGSKNSYWIGAQRNSSRVFDKWVTGEKIVYEHYKDGRPDNIYEDALMIYRNDNPGAPGYCFGFWNDMYRDGERPGEKFFGKQNTGFICEWDNVDFTDSNGDGFYDRFEIKGLQLSNGQIIYPNIHDFSPESPEINSDTYAQIWDNQWQCLVFHAKYWYGLTDEFIYVDGRQNKNEKYYSNDKMNYIGHPEGFCKDKYEKEISVAKFDEPEKIVKGKAGVHNSYLYLCIHNPKKYTSYIVMRDLLRSSVKNSESNQSDITLFPATRCLLLYFFPPGGIMSDSTRREWVDIEYMLDNLFNNSMAINYKKNLNKAIIASKGVLSDSNNEIYIALSPDRKWLGSSYWGDYDSIEEMNTALFNISAYGTFNSSDATMTLHAKKDMDNRIDIELNYYIVDYYDFDNLKALDDLNALGLACSYELYGRYNDNFSVE